MPDRLWRERTPIRFRLGASAAVILHVVNGLLDLSRRQHIQGRLTELADQVRSQLTVPFHCFRGAAAAGMFLEPVLEKFSEGRAGTIRVVFGLLAFFSITSRNRRAQCSLGFNPILKSPLEDTVERIGIYSSPLGARFSGDSAGGRFVFVDSGSDGLGCGVFSGKSGFANLDSFPVCVPTAEEHVAPAYASVPFPFENAPSHLQPTADHMTLTSDSPEQQVWRPSPETVHYQRPAQPRATSQRSPREVG